VPFLSQAGLLRDLKNSRDIRRQCRVAKWGKEAAEDAPAFGRIKQMGVPFALGTDGNRAASHNPWVGAKRRGTAAFADMAWSPCGNDLFKKCSKSFKRLGSLMIHGRILRHWRCSTVCLRCSRGISLGEQQRRLVTRIGNRSRISEDFLRRPGYGQSNAPSARINWGIGDLSSGGLRMNIDDSRIIARFQRLLTGSLAAKRLGQWHPELIDELYRTSLDLDQRGLKKSPEYRNVMLRADQQAEWLAGLARLSSPDPLECIATLSDHQKAA
jgi:hypothetical protein